MLEELRELKFVSSVDLVFIRWNGRATMPLLCRSKSLARALTCGAAQQKKRSLEEAARS